MLLEKLPEDRYSMAQALDHEWLAEPSSQTTESQLDRLGGDAMYDIESFSDDEVNERVGDWTRPSTASATNFGGDSIRESTSHESFSQPMGNLRLETPIKTAEEGTPVPKRKPEAFSSGSLTPPPPESSPAPARPRKSMRLA